MLDEKRRARRFDLALPVTLVSVGEKDTGQTVRTKDISSSGIFLELDEKVQSGTKVEMVVCLPEEITQAGAVRLKCIGRIVRVDRADQRMGVAITIERYEFLRSQNPGGGFPQ